MRKTKKTTQNAQKTQNFPPAAGKVLNNDYNYVQENLFLHFSSDLYLGNYLELDKNVYI